MTLIFLVLQPDFGESQTRFSSAVAINFQLSSVCFRVHPQFVLYMLHILSVRRFCYTGVPKWVPAGLGSGPWIWTMSKITKLGMDL